MAVYASRVLYVSDMADLYPAHRTALSIFIVYTVFWVRYIGRWGSGAKLAELGPFLYQ